MVVLNKNKKITFFYFLPVVALFIFVVHQLVKTWTLIDFFLPFTLSPSFSIVLQNQNLVDERASVLYKQ